MDDRKSTLKTALLWIMVIVGVFVLLHSVFVGGTSRRIQAELARIKARGEPVSAADLAGPPIPDDRNAAIVYQQVFNLMQSPALKGDLDTVEMFCAPDYRAKTAKEWAEATAAAGRLAEVIAITEDAGKLPECRFPVDWSQGFSARFPHYAYLRQMARLLAVEAVVSAHSGSLIGPSRCSTWDSGPRGPSRTSQPSSQYSCGLRF